jgi:hypothetical protein
MTAAAVERGHGGERWAVNARSHPNRTETDFEEWREDAAYHAAKYARWDRKGERGI